MRFLSFHNMILILLFLVWLCQAADPVAVVIKSSGTVSLAHGESSETKKVEHGQLIADGDVIRTGDESSCTVKFIDDNSLVQLQENSACKIDGQRNVGKIDKNIEVESGAVFVSLPDLQGKFTATTATSVATVKGTEFWILCAESGRTVYIGLEGMIDLNNKAGRVLLRSGQTAVYESDSHLPEIRLTEREEIPTPSEAEQLGGRLVIEFTDENGASKKLILDFKEK